MVERKSAGFRACVKNSDGPQPSGCINVRTTLGSKSRSVFEDKWRAGKEHAWENIDAPRLRTLKQPEGCGPSESAICRFHTRSLSCINILTTTVG